MKNDVELSASLMCLDWLNVEGQLRELEDASVDYLHYDIIDGTFAPDFTMGSSIINTIKSATQIPCDYHLMVDEPGRIFDMFEFAENDFFTIHQESSRNLHRDLVKIRKNGAKVGVALSPATNLQVLEYLIEDIDLVTLMTVNPGYMGQPMVPQVITKIRKLKEFLIASKLERVKISVDGNVNATTIVDMVGSGADRLVLGSSGLFIKGKTIKESISKIQTAISEGLERREQNGL